MLKKIRIFLDRKDKINLVLLVIGSVIISLQEALTLGLIMPFIGVATNFNSIHNNIIISKFYNYFKFSNEKLFVIYFGIFLIILYITRIFINLFYTYSLNKFSYGKYKKISKKLFQNFLMMKYKDFINKNSADITKAIVSDGINITSIIAFSLIILSESLIIFMIFLGLLIINFKIMLGLIAIVSLVICFLKFKITKKIKECGIIREQNIKKFFKIILNSFNNFKFIKLHSESRRIKDNFDEYTAEFAKVQIAFSTMSIIPRMSLETTGFILIFLSLILTIYYTGKDISLYIGTITVFVTGLYRILPSFNRILDSYHQIKYFEPSVDIIFDFYLLNSENLGNESINFNNKI